MTFQTRGFVPVTGSAKRINAAGCRTLADYSNAIAQALARTVATKCIKVNTINPGLIDVPKPRFSSDSADAEKASPDVPLGRLYPYGDLAAVCFPMHPAASYITSVPTDANGGDRMQPL